MKFLTEIPDCVQILIAALQTSHDCKNQVRDFHHALFGMHSDCQYRMKGSGFGEAIPGIGTNVIYTDICSNNNNKKADIAKLNFICVQYSSE